MKVYLFGRILALVVTVGLMAVSSAKAETLQDLIDTNGSIIVDGIEFSSFGYLKTGNMPLAADINVVPLFGPGNSFGLRFQGGFIDLPGGSASDALITYVATVLNPNPLFAIASASLAGNPSVTGMGGPDFIGVTETFLPLTEHMEINAQDGLSKLTDSVTFAIPQRVLNVQKDILGAAGETAVTLSFIDQTFVLVPEPLSAIMLLSGGLGAMFMVRRLRRSSQTYATSA